MIRLLTTFSRQKFRILFFNNIFRQFNDLLPEVLSAVLSAFVLHIFVASPAQVTASTTAFAITAKQSSAAGITILIWIFHKHCADI